MTDHRLPLPLLIARLEERREYLALGEAMGRTTADVGSLPALLAQTIERLKEVDELTQRIARLDQQEQQMEEARQMWNDNRRHPTRAEME